MTSQHHKLLDTTGRHILRLLAEDARMSYAEIARRVHLSTPAVIERITRMEETGIITGFVAAVDHRLLGYTVTAIVTLKTEPVHYPLVQRIVSSSLQVEQCDHVTGAASFVMRVSASSIAHLEEFIRQFAPIGSTDTAIVMSSLDTSDLTRKRIDAQSEDA